MSDARAIVRWSRAAKGARRIALRLAGWLIGAALLAGGSSAYAASATWDGSESGAWVTGSNWVGDAAPGAINATTTDTATFNNAINTTITVDSGRTVGAIVFDNGAGGFSFRGSTLFTSQGTGTSFVINGANVGSQTFYVDISGTGGTGVKGLIFNKSAGASLGAIYNIFGNVRAGTGATTTTAGNVLNFSAGNSGNTIAMVRGTITNPTTSGETAINAASTAGALVWLRGANTYTGFTNLTRGAYIFDSVTNVGGGASSFGSVTTAASGSLTIGSSTPAAEQSLYYAGLSAAGHSTDRVITMRSASNLALTAAGAGPLTWTGTVASPASANTFIVAGPSAAENRLGGVLADTGAFVMSLWKRGNGTWNLTGANTYTGTTQITSGLLRIDFANSGAVNTNIISTSSPLATGGGRLDVRGDTGEANSQAFNGTTFREGSMAISLTSGSGGSVSLALGALSRGIAGTGSNSGSTVDFSLGSSGTVSTTSSSTTNGVLTVGGVAFASVNKSDWATVSGGAIGAVSSYASGTVSLWQATDNVSLSQNPTANVTTGTINTLRLASSSTVTITSGNTLSLAAGGILATGGGGAMLITGGTIRGADNASQLNRDLVILQHNTTNPLTIASVIADAASGATSLTKGGDGMLELSGANTFSGGITIGGGVLKISNANAMGSSGVKFAGGILGLTSDLSASVSVPLNVAGRVQWLGSGGFAAYGGNRTVTFSTNLDLSAAGANANSQRNGELLLSAPDADGKITLATTASGTVTIASTASMPYIGTIRVYDGSAAVDAEISAPISVVTDGKGGIQKMGAGVLQLSGSNTYNGPTIVAEGGLVVTGTNYNAMVTEVRNGAWLGGNGMITSLEVQSGGTVTPGARSGAASTIGTLSTTANAGNGYFLWNGSTNSAAQMAFQLSTTDNTSDRLNLGTDNFIKGGTSATSGTTFQFDFQNSGGKVGQTYTLVSFGTTSYTTASDFSYTNLGTYTGTFALTSSELTFTIPYLSTTYTLTGSAAATAIRVGGTTSIGATVTNTGANDQYDQVGFSGLAVTVSGGTLSLSPASGTAAPVNGTANGTGSFTTNTAGGYTLTPIVASATNVNLGTAASGSTSTFSVSVWNPAAANAISGTYSLGVVLVSSTLSKTLSITNTAPNAGFSEKLDASFGSLSGVTTNSGSISLLAPQATNNTALTISLASGSAGASTGSAVVNFWTDGQGTSGLGSEALASQTVFLTGTFLDPAVASFSPSLLTTSTVAFGEVAEGQGTLSQTFDIWNLAQTAGFTADLWLYDIVSGTGNTATIDTTLATFTNLASGTFNQFTASLSTSTAGEYTNYYTLYFKSRSGSTDLGGTQTLNLAVWGVVVAAVPEPSSVVLAAVGIGLAGLAARRRRRNGHAAEPARHGR